MRKLVAACALALCVLAGTARADDATFVVVPNAPTMQVPLPAADVPGLTGSLQLAWTSPPVIPQQLPYPQLLSLWQRAGAAYGINWQVLAAINKVESNFGRNMGPSSAGAIGWMQFMPSTWLRWGTDANGDGIADPWNPDDAVFSAARYLSAAGGRTDIARAVFAYNHADWYVREVLSLANLFGNAGSSGTFALDRLQMTLDRAEQAVADAAQALAQARRDAQRLRGKRDVLLVRAGAQPLLSARIDLEARAGEADYAAGSASSRVERARKRLAAARAELVRARAESQAASFAPGAAQMLSSPSFQDGYVFPVGGGPSLVSASHTHHDYPAVDIAAPEGSPVYALANAVVLEAWAGVDPRCGIGLTVRTEDNLVWTYCHLSYREPSVQPGALLSAGQPVGLVGSTGHATGPHLHLQLQPATAWPQQMPWFQHFAGLAFRWQDGETRSLDAVGVAAARGPVFAEVPTPAASPDRVIAFSVG